MSGWFGRSSAGVAVSVSVLVALALALAGCTTTSDQATSTPTASPTPTAVPTPKGRAASALTITCSDKGIRATSKAVAAQSDGVVVRSRSTSERATTVAFRAQTADGRGGVEGVLPVASERRTAIIPAPPGLATISCQSGAGDRIGATLTVRVDDPTDSYRDVDVQKVLGCIPDRPVDGPTARAMATPNDAIAELANQVSGSATGSSTLGPGYQDSTAVVGLIKKDGKGYGTSRAELQSNGSWLATMTALC